MEFTEEEKRRYDALINDSLLAAVPGTWLHDHQREYFWWLERNVPIDSQTEFVYRLIREVEGLRKTLEANNKQWAIIGGPIPRQIISKNNAHLRGYRMLKAREQKGA